MEVIKADTLLTNLYYFPTLQFLYLELKPNVDFTLSNVIKEHQAINEIKKDANVRLLVNIKKVQYEHFPKESLQYFSDNQYSKYQIKKGILIKGLGQKMLGNFYLKFFKPNVNTRMFSEIETALDWFEIIEKSAILKELKEQIIA